MISLTQVLIWIVIAAVIGFVGECSERIAGFLVNFFSHSISIFVRSVNNATLTHGEKEA